MVQYAGGAGGRCPASLTRVRAFSDFFSASAFGLAAVTFLAILHAVGRLFPGLSFGASLGSASRTGAADDTTPIWLSMLRALAILV